MLKEKTGCAVAIVISMTALVVLVFLLDYLLLEAGSSLSDRVHHYEYVRDALVIREMRNHYGGHESLDALERLANGRLMAAKAKAYEVQRNVDPDVLYSSETYMDTTLFQLLRHMPKGGALHVHDLSLASVEQLLLFSRQEWLWACVGTRNSADRVGFPFEGSFERLRFAQKRPPAMKGHANAGNSTESSSSAPACDWHFLAHLRGKDRNGVDQQLSAQLALPCQPCQRCLRRAGKGSVETAMRGDCGSGAEVAGDLEKVLRLRQGLLTYAPIFKEFYARVLLDFYADGLQYVEIRSALPLLYDLNSTSGGGHNYTLDDTIEAIEQAVEDFSFWHNDFIGGKVIYAPLKLTSDDAIEASIQNALHLKRKYPHVLAGFDPIGQLDGGLPLQHYTRRLLALREHVALFMHAGGATAAPSSDNRSGHDSIIDAVLMAPQRIGHAHALARHPDLVHRLAIRNIAVEVMPIASQVLRRVPDLRDDPAAALFAEGRVPLVVSSDRPGLWGAAPLTHDFYAAFVGIAAPSADLGTLRLLAHNSLRHSALEGRARQRAVQLWRARWDAWITDMVNEADSPEGGVQAR